MVEIRGVGGRHRCGQTLVGDELEQPVGGGSGEERGVENVEDSAETGEAAGVFDAGVAFQKGFEEVADLSDDAENRKDW